MARPPVKSSNSTARPPESESPGTSETRDRVRSESVVIPMIRGLKVLVLGTSKRRREELARSLRKHEVQALATTSDEHGYRAALKMNPDVAISEMAKPGDPGWWLFKRFHRHPVLKWTPALLMNWWQEKNGKEEILARNVFERLGEALTPIRLLEERVAAGRPLKDRVETTGMPTVVSVVSSAGLSGKMSVNDSWNVFNIIFASGAPISITRRGVDGKEDRGHAAWLQMLLTDNGHWTLQPQAPGNPERNIFLSEAELFEWARQKLSMMFGPDVALHRTTLIESLHVDRSLFHDVASTFDGLGRDLLEGLSAGASEKELEAIMNKQEERVDAELAMIALVRCGALYFQEKPTPGVDGQRDARRVTYVLDWIARDHQTEHREDVQFGGQKRKITTGFYSFNNPAFEKIHGNVDKYKAKQDSSETVNLNDNGEGREGSELETGDASWRRQFNEEPERRISKFLGVVPHDSFTPGPSPEERTRLQMWLAIVIAIILGTLLITGLVVIGSDSSAERTAPDSARD